MASKGLVRTRVKENEDVREVDKKATWDKKSGQYKQVEVKGRRAEDANGVESRVHKSK